jgi:hypothetical protein
MRNRPAEFVEKYRKRHPLMGDSHTGSDFGYFEIPYKSFTLRVIACAGIDSGWDHVSVSLKNRCPNWEEMSFIKDLFWKPSECVVQYHPAENDYVNIHPNCLHMWKPLHEDLPTPPIGFV